MFIANNNGAQLEQITNKENLIYNVTLTQSVNNVFISKDNNNNDFALSRAKLKIYIPQNSIANNATANVLCQINGITSVNYFSTTLGFGTKINLGVARNLSTILSSNLELVGGNMCYSSSCLGVGLQADGVARAATSGVYVGGTFQMGNLFAINSLRFDEFTFPIGTIFILEGVRA